MKQQFFFDNMSVMKSATRVALLLFTGDEKDWKMARDRYAKKCVATSAITQIFTCFYSNSLIHRTKQTFSNWIGRSIKQMTRNTEGKKKNRSRHQLN